MRDLMGLDLVDLASNFASYEVFDSSGGSPRTLTDKLENANRLLTKSKGGDQDYWATVFKKALQSCLMIAAEDKANHPIDLLPRLMTQGSGA